MIRRKRVTIAFIVNDIYLFQGCCSAEISIDSNGQILDETICDYIEDLEDVEFVEINKDNYDEEDEANIPSELDITESDIQRIYNIIHIVN